MSKTYELTGAYDHHVLDVVDTVTVELPVSTLLGIRRSLRNSAEYYKTTGQDFLSLDAKHLADQITGIYRDLGVQQ